VRDIARSQQERIVVGRIFVGGKAVVETRFIVEGSVEGKVVMSAQQLIKLKNAELDTPCLREGAKVGCGKDN
jgi:hypothetical protein